MNTLILGSSRIPRKYRKYVEDIKAKQAEGQVYEKKVVDELIEKFLEIVKDNEYIKSIYKLKESELSVIKSEKLDQMVKALEHETGMAQASVIEIEKTVKKETRCEEETGAEYVSGKSRAKESLETQLLQIKEEFSELRAYTLSVLLIISELEDALNAR